MMSNTNKTRLVLGGEIIFLEGDTGDCAYLIEQGQVLVYLSEGSREIPVRVLGAGEIFGEMALIDDHPRSASCRALSTCNLIVVTKEQLADRVQEADPVVRLLMRALTERLRSQTKMLRGSGPNNSRAERSGSVGRSNEGGLRHITMEHRIARGVDNDEFIPHYQPIYDLKTGELRGCEALLRWKSRGRIIKSQEFMDILEGSPLILRVGQMVIEKSFADFSRLHAASARPDFFVSINVSGRQFADPGFVSQLERARLTSGLRPEHIKLELTERIMAQGKQVLSTLMECRRLGYLLAIDDFGTGFSSLRYLAEMPLTDLKIDRSFVARLLSDQKSALLVQSLVWMASLLGLKIIAEGIEHVDQLEILRNYRVEMGQGYYFGRPVPVEKFVNLGPSKSDVA